MTDHDHEAPTRAHAGLDADPASDRPAGVEPVRAPGRRGARWAVALVAVALVVAASAAAVLLVTGKAPEASVLGWVPDDSVAYGELRLDLPGDQRQELGAFLSKFPGFRDQAALDTKVNEVLDRLVSSATDGEQTFTADIDPWFGGELVFAVGPLPDPAAAELDATEGRGLVLLSIEDREAARAWFADVLAEGATTTETYGGTEITLVQPPGDASEMRGVQGAFAILSDGAAVLGDAESVRAAIDTGGTSGFAADPALATALEAGTEDHVGFMFVDARAYMDWTRALYERYGDEMGPMPGAALMDRLSPEWIAGWLRVERDGLVFDLAMPEIADRPGPTEDRPSDLTDRVPASALVYLEVHDLGATVLETIELYRSDPTAAEAIAEVEQMAGLLGGFRGILGWMGDGAIVVDRAGDELAGGIVTVPTDQQEAESFLLSIKTLIGFGGANAGVAVREEQHGDVTITVVELGGLVGAGMVPGLEPGGEMPSEIAWAVTDDLVVLGVGTTFVERVLDTTAGDSLAGSPGFGALVERVGAENAGLAYVDIAAARELLEGVMADDPASAADYEREVKPFLLPFDALIQATSVSGELDRTRAVITVE